jgi:hypothetical protein
VHSKQSKQEVVTRRGNIIYTFFFSKWGAAPSSASIDAYGFLLEIF